MKNSTALKSTVRIHELLRCGRFGTLGTLGTRITFLIEIQINAC